MRIFTHIFLLPSFVDRVMIIRMFKQVKICINKIKYTSKPSSFKSKKKGLLQFVLKLIKCKNESFVVHGHYFLPLPL